MGCFFSVVVVLGVCHVPGARRSGSHVCQLAGEVVTRESRLSKNGWRVLTEAEHHIPCGWWLGQYQMRQGYPAG